MKTLLKALAPHLLIGIGFFILPILFFAPATLGGKTLIPTDNLYQYEPWASYRAEQGVPEIPHNALLSDLIFQNYQWKTFIRQNISDQTIPLWQPNQFSGTPFWANGQHSMLYPFSLIYYVLPLEYAFAWFTVSQLWLAGVLMYLLLRGLGQGTFAGIIAGVAYQLSGFMVVGTVHPMIQAAAAWLPLLILMLEFIIQRRPVIGDAPASAFGVLPWVLIGSVALGMSFLAGHIEITYYTLVIMALYGGLRLLVELFKLREKFAETLRTSLISGLLMLFLVGLGIGIGAAQFIPLVETANESFRTERSELSEVRGYALPARHVVKWVLPNGYGNPAHHDYLDVFSGDTFIHDWQRNNPDGTQTRVTNTDFGIKNYVEGGVYVGILTLLLAALGIFNRQAPHRWVWIVLAGIAGLFMFGTPAYAIFYYAFPATEQLHTPFRWSWLFTVVLCILAGYGTQTIVDRQFPILKRLATGFIALGGVILGGLLLSRVLYDAFTHSIVDRLYTGLAKASDAFPNAEAFYSYQFWQVLVLGGVILGIGILLRLSQSSERSIKLPQIGTIPFWQIGIVIILFADLWLATGNFNTAADPNWLRFTPPSITWLQEQQDTALANGDTFRIQAYDWGERPLIANTGWQYGLEDVRGYDSLFSKQYADYMAQIAPQTGLDFNRINPIFYNQPETMLAPQLDWLNVRYIITDWIIRPEEEFGVGDLSEVDLELAEEFAGVRIYENLNAKPRSFAIAKNDLQAGMITDTVDYSPATITDYQSSTVYTDIMVEDDSWLVMSATYSDGWRAFIRPIGTGEDQEDEIEIQRVQENFMAVELADGAWTVRWRYSPQSFQLGAFASFVTGMLVIFLLLVWAWRTFIGEAADADSARRVIKNSLAPIFLNLFNRGIDFAFAFIMLRILAPEGAGIYYYAIVIFGWFDILTNFGLNTLLTREVSRDQSQAGQYLINTSMLRLGLAAAGVPVLGIFLLLRNNLISPALDETALLAIWILYVGLIPNSISTGLSALFYAFEKAEYPAALATVSTMVKVTLGLGALLLGWGVVGLAGVSIITNVVTLVLMLRLALPLIRGAANATERTSSLLSQISPTLMRGMMVISFPLMLNHLLATVFFKSDVILMEAINGVTIVGIYSTAYKWLDALNIIPAFFTMALLPMLSRQAHEDRPAMTRNYVFGFKFLVILALPVSVIITFLAPTLIGILGGAEFLPDGGIALQIMIWSIPLGWINSLTQYVLIALDRQRLITGAFIVAVSFNIITNLIFLPAYSYRAAALTTIASELVLLFGFYYLLRDVLSVNAYLAALWRPIVATSLMFGLIFILWRMSPIMALLAAGVSYPLILILLKPLTPEEGERIGRVLPPRIKTLFIRS